MQRSVQHTVNERGVRPVVPQTRATTRPYVTYTLIAINVAIFALCTLQARSADAGLSRIFQHGDLVVGLVGGGDYWRLLTSGFLHFTVAHLALNMISLFILGRDLEVALGRGRFLLVYMTALFGGSAAVMFFENPLARSAGASGAIYGLMGAMLVVVLRSKIPPTGVIAIIGINLVFSFTVPNISLLAHVGGLIFGAAATAAILYLPDVLVPAEARNASSVSRVGWVGASILLVVAIVAGVVGGIIYDGPLVILG